LLTLSAGGCGARGVEDSAEPLAWTLQFTPAALRVPSSSSEPQITESARGAIVSWVEGQEGTATVGFSERGASGWSEPRVVVAGDNWFRSYADMPSVLRLSNGTLVANWLPATDPLIEAYDLYLAYSTDDGLTWSEPFTPHHDGTTTQHGFASIFEQAEGGIGLVWLDGRQQELDLESPDGGAMSVRFAAFDTDWSQTADMLVDDRVCECCPTTVGRTREGVITAFRDRTANEVRDIHVARLVGNAWTPSVSVHDDNWELQACPVNGPMLSANGDQVAVAWFTATTGVGHAYVAFSDDGGRTFGTPIQFDDTSAMGRVGLVLLPDGSVAASWLEFIDSRTQLRVRRVEPSGTRSTSIVVSGEDVGRPSGYPRMAASDDRLIVAWTETTPPVDGDDGVPQIQVRVAEALLP